MRGMGGNRRGFGGRDGGLPDFDFSGFRLDRGSGDLAMQLAKRMEEAVDGGELRPGERLPTVAQWAEALGVSAFVPRRAMGMLAKRGALEIKRHVGASVACRVGRAVRKRVLCLSVDTGNIWARNVFSFTLGKELRRAGFRYVHVSIFEKSGRRKVGRIPAEAFDCSELDDVLNDGVDFAWCSCSAPWVVKRLEDAGIPFAVANYGREIAANHADVFSIDFDAMATELERRLKAAKCRTVTLVGPGTWVPDFVSSHLYASGMGFSKIAVYPHDGRCSPDCWQRGAMEEFDRRLSSGTSPLPDAFFFSDDYIAAGALLAMTRHGIESPRDVKVVTFANKGLGPVYFRPLARFENDPERNAKEVARYIAARLKGRQPRGPRLSYRFVPGATL